MGGVIDMNSSDIRWETAGGISLADLSRLFGSRGLGLDGWLALGAARVLKQASHRSLYRIVLPGLDVHVKHYPAAGRRGWLRGLLRRSAARLEYERTRAVAARGVPTVEPLAVGESSRAGVQGSWLLTRTIPEAVPLDVFLERMSGDPPAALRQRLAQAVGRLLARMHDAGLRHQDLHPGNILVRLGTGDEPELFLLDLLLVRLGRPVCWRAARANLVILNRWFQLRSHRSDRLRGWLAYRGARANGFGQLLSLDGAVRDLEQATQRSNLHFWRGHDGRCLGGNRHFRRFRHGELVGHAATDLDDTLLETLLADADAFFGTDRGGLLKRSASSSVAEVCLAGRKAPRQLIYKCFHLRRVLDPVVALMRPTQALRSYIMGHALRARCLPTPRPLAVWHRRRHGLPHEGYLVTEKVPEAVELRMFVDRLSSQTDPQSRVRLRRLLDQLGCLLSRLHERHLSHRDLKAANLLVSPAAAVITSRGIAPLSGRSPAGTGRDQVWFIDLVGVRRLRKIKRRRRVLDLARLHASFHDHPGLTRTDRLRFLRMYLRWGLRGRYGWKRWWHQIAEATRGKIERHRREGRPLA